MPDQIEITGHVQNRIFTYTDDKKNGAGQYICREYTLPGGAALLARLLGTAAGADADAPTERLRLYRYQTKAHSDYYAVECSMGVSKSEPSVRGKK